jgi:hypothetical protein
MRLDRLAAWIAGDGWPSLELHGRPTRLPRSNI